MATFTWTPDYGASAEVESRVRVAGFGEGYSQRVVDGINSQVKTWDLRFSLRSTAESDAIWSFLKTQGKATSFNWTDPDGDALVWVCERFKRSRESYGSSPIEATFKQVYGE